MKVCEIMLSPEDKAMEVQFIARRKKKNNPKESKTTKMNSFIDVFGGMAGYSSTRSRGSINPNAGST